MALSELHPSIIPWVGKTAKLQRLFIAAELKAMRLDLSIEQWFLLKNLYQEDGLNQNDLACITDRNKASLARLLNTLEKKNLVARIPSQEDKRVNMIYLTKQGRDTYQKTIPVVNTAFEVLQQGISAEERALAIGILNKIQNNIKGSLK